MVSDENKVEIFVEKSQGPEKFRPWGIFSCKEDYNLLKDICKFMEDDIRQAMDGFQITYRDKVYSISLKIMPMMDTKAIRLSTGIGGTKYCTMGSCEADQWKDSTAVSRGFESDRDIVSTNNLFRECQEAGLMERNEKGTLKKQGKKARKKRLGLTNEPLFRDVYDPHKCLPPLHWLLNELTNFEQFLYHFNARQHFPNRIPKMGVGQTKTKRQMKKVKEAKYRVIDKAKNTLKILLDSPDSGGTAGNTGSMKMDMN